MEKFIKVIVLEHTNILLPIPFYKECYNGRYTWFELY